jgi:hypothetical protein
MIKMFEAFKFKNYSLIFESADKIGIDLESLLEAAKQDQLQAIDIVAKAIDLQL